MGVDIRDDIAHFCLGRRVGLDIEIVRVGSIGLPEHDPSRPERLEERRLAFEDGLALHGVVERRAIVALREEESLDIAHPGAHRVPKTEWDSSALVYAKEKRGVIPDGEALVARMVVDGDRATIFAVLQSHIDAARAEAESLGLRPVVVDSPQEVWIRVAPNGIIALDHAHSGFVVVPLEGSIHGQHITPPVDHETVTIVQTLNTFRTNVSYRGQVINSMLPPGHSLYARPNETTILPLSIDGYVTPAWAFACGLFLWNESVAA